VASLLDHFIRPENDAGRNSESDCIRGIREGEFDALLWQPHPASGS
jgi:hypothetical protein